MAAAAASTTSADSTTAATVSTTGESGQTVTAATTTATTTTGTETEGLPASILEEWAKTREAYNQAASSYAEVQRQEQLLFSQQQQQAEEQKSEKSLWVGGVPPNAIQMDIDKLFNRYGIIDTIRINGAKACAFVKFRDKESATNAYNNTFSNATICGRPVRIGWAKNDAVDEETFVSSTAWAGNLDPSVSELEIRHLFSQYGEILQVKILPEKMCAFINYADQDSVRKAKNALNGYSLRARPLKIGYGKVYNYLIL